MRAQKRPVAPSVPGNLSRSGTIVLGTDGPGFCITLQRVSRKGARLRQAFPFPVPETFSLVTFNAATNSHDETPCEKVWQRGDLVSARFL